MTGPLSFNEPPRRILLVKPSAIGDVVHTLPVLALLRRRWPESHIAWLVAPACAGLLTGHPLLSEVVLFDRRGLSAWYRSLSAARELRELLGRLRSAAYDVVLDLQGLLRSGLLTYATGAPVRVGLASAREGAGAFYTHHVPDTGANRHAIDRYLDAAAFLGLGRGPVEFVFNTTADDVAAAETMLRTLGGRPVAVLLPGANWLTKRWPASHFAELASGLRRQGLAVVVAGAASDDVLAREIGPDLSLCGRTTLAQLTAVLAKAAVVVANDTGPMHIAAALGRPLVTLYGPTDPVRTGPWGRDDSVLRVALPCAPCLSRTCVHQSCLQWLEPQRVLAAALHAMEQAGRQDDVLLPSRGP